MNEPIVNLTIYFDDPFWVGVFERIESGNLSVCKVTFGAEPKSADVWAFVLRNYYRLKFSPAVKTNQKRSADNPKRRQRNAKKQMQIIGIGTKSQQALAAARETLKTERKKVHREQKETAQQRRFDIRQQKRKEKHKGH